MRGLTKTRRSGPKLLRNSTAPRPCFSNVSHEFRTPLTLMLGSRSRMLAESMDSRPSIMSAWTLHIETHSACLSSSIRSWISPALKLDVFRLPMSQPTFPTDLRTCECLPLRHRSGRPQFPSSMPRFGEPVYVDREMWEKIVLNLFSNAFKFTFDGEIEIFHWEGDAGPGTYRPGYRRRHSC